MDKESSTDFYIQFAKDFSCWAEHREDIRAAFIIGSQARKDHPADKWSDMDILIFTVNPSFYLEQAQWLDNFGKVLCSFSTLTLGGDPERLTLFEDGYQVDIVVSDTEELNRLVASNTIYGNFYRGVKVLVDKDSISYHIMPIQAQAAPCQAISQSSFSLVCHKFWFSALYIVKQIFRGEMWIVKARDSDIKSLVLQMIEWHEKCINGDDYDTWHAGRFMQEWVNSDTWNALYQCFAHFDARDSWAALMETVYLFRRLSHFVAAQMSYALPEAEQFFDLWLDAHKNDVASIH